jgi:hypothetical protein
MNPQSKPFLIDKGLVYEAYLEVRSKRVQAVSTA